jgi:hypothetical protein
MVLLLISYYSVGMSSLRPEQGHRLGQGEMPFLSGFQAITMAAWASDVDRL